MRPQLEALGIMARGLIAWPFSGRSLGAHFDRIIETEKAEVQLLALLPKHQWDEALRSVQFIADKLFHGDRLPALRALTDAITAGRRP